MNKDIFERQEQLKQQIQESFIPDELIEKGKEMPIGTISHGYKKVGKGDWRKVSEGKKEKNNDVDSKVMSDAKRIKEEYNKLKEESDKKPKDEVLKTKLAAKEEQPKRVSSLIRNKKADIEENKKAAVIYGDPQKDEEKRREKKEAEEKKRKSRVNEFYRTDLSTKKEDIKKACDILNLQYESNDEIEKECKKGQKDEIKKAMEILGFEEENLFEKALKDKE